ncbi:MAG: hypothetical protein II852_04080 [Bacteroidales bacterium]|nr:hypothetical protein [Bacteroidales bacterium]
MYERKTRVLFFIAMTVSLIGKLYMYSVWPLHELANKFAVIGLCICIPRIISVLYSIQMKYALLWCILCPFMLFICYNVHERTYVLFPFCFCIAAWNIPFRSIIKVFFLINLVFFIVTVSSSILGIIANENYGRYELDMTDLQKGNTFKNRYCFGYNWPTATAAHVTYLNIMWFYLRKGILKKIDYIIIGVSIWFVMSFCDARTDMVCMFLIVMISIYYRYRVNYSWVEKKLLSYSVPICAFIFIFLTYQYQQSDSEFYKMLNVITSGRLKLGADALFSYGVKIFGQEYIQHGGVSDDYNFIDCSYLVWLIIYGALFFALGIITFVIICKRSMATKEYLTALCLAILSIESSIATVMLTFSFNPFFMALFAKNTNTSEKKINISYNA